MISHALAFVSGFMACFALLLFESFYPITLRRKVDEDPGGGFG